MTTAGPNWTFPLACLLVGVTAVLLSFGALVTTYDAAMAVPDWPATYGHNMFLFPFAEWFYGPWDLFLEHGHRLLGATVGLITLALAAVVWLKEPQATVRALVVAAVVLVLVQGALGGARVLLDDKTVAKVHACTGPLFFAVAVALAVLTRAGGRSSASTPRAGWTAAALVVAIYMQLVAGAQLRHVDPSMPPDSFRGLVALHVGGAVVVLLLAFASAAHATTWKSWPVAILIGACAQWLLGLGTWIVSWGLPTGLIPEAWQPDVALRARGGWTAAIVTGHVLLGMLMLGLSVAAAIRAGALDHVAALGHRGDARRWRRFA